MEARRKKKHTNRTCAKRQLAIDSQLDFAKQSHVDIEPPNVGFEIDRFVDWDLGRLGSRRERCMDIGFDQQFFLT